MQLAVSLQHNGHLLTGKKAANHFIEMYEKISNISVTQSGRKEVHWKTQDFVPHEATDEVMTSAFSEKELDEAMKNLKPKKSPGPDAVTN